MGALSDVVADAEKKQAVVRDAAVLMDEEVASKSGVGGLVVKAVFATVKAVKPGVIPEAIEGLLPDFAQALDPILAERKDGTPVAAHLLQHESRVVQALLSVTDDRAKRSTHHTLLKAYEKLRPTAERQVSAGLPRLAKLVEKHVGG